MKHPYRHIGTAFIALGALLLSAGSQTRFEAQLHSSQGAYLGTYHAGQPMMIDQHTVLPAAIEQPEPTMGLLAFGMLMMLIGFGFHALLVLREEDKRAVPVHVREQPHTNKKPKKAPRTSRKQMEVIWVERTIRF